MKTLLETTIRLTGWLLVLSLLGGCGARIRVKPSPGSASITSPAANERALAHPPALLKKVQLTRNGVKMAADDSEIDHYLTAVESGGLFSHVAYRSGAASNKEVAAITLEMNQTEHLNVGANVTKAFFIGFTLFLLTPALPMTYGFDSDLTATIAWTDGEQIVCRRRAKGRCAYNFFYPSTIATQGTQAKVVDEIFKVLTPEYLRAISSSSNEQTQSSAGSTSPGDRHDSSIGRAP